MTVNQRIMEHLEKTSNIKFRRSSPNLKLSQEATLPPPPPTLTTLPTTPDSRKKRVMEHLTLSGANFDLSSLNSQKRKQKVEDHVSKTRS